MGSSSTLELGPMAATRHIITRRGRPNREGYSSRPDPQAINPERFCLPPAHACSARKEGFRCKRVALATSSFRELPAVIAATSCRDEEQPRWPPSSLRHPHALQPPDRPAVRLTEGDVKREPSIPIAANLVSAYDAVAITLQRVVHRDFTVARIGIG